MSSAGARLDAVGAHQDAPPPEGSTAPELETSKTGDKPAELQQAPTKTMDLNDVVVEDSASTTPATAELTLVATAPTHGTYRSAMNDDAGPAHSALRPVITAPAMPVFSHNDSSDDDSNSITESEFQATKHLRISVDGLKTSAHLTDHGLDVDIDKRNSLLEDLLKPALSVGDDQIIQQIPPYLAKPVSEKCPPLNVVIQIVGSRGDVQPFVSLGKVLREKYGHRVRIATHLVFKEFIQENGLEFFNIGGDPAELMAFMVHNPGLIPDVATIRSGEVGKRRKGTHEMLVGCWRSCIESGDGTGKPIFECARDKETGDAPFIADAIIANPPSFAHIHCAEKLGIPLHLMFTMPWSPTKSFPHPLVNIRSSNADGDQTNFISYALVEMMTWQGLGDVINKFRKSILNLPPISLMWAPLLTHRLRVPFTYCWSPALIPKPRDWGSHISISGFYFLSLASSFTPAPDLLEFLAAGPPPVYIGFGSIVVDDPDGMTKMIFDAVKKAGVRALVSKGWGGLGASDLGQPKEIFMLGNVPHDWLFQHVSAVVHHGGAGTTAAGIAAGKPTVVVPFFGDQPFWGAMIARAGAGPNPIPYKQLNVDNLVSQLQFALKPETLIKAKLLGEKMAKEKGAEEGASLFHEHLGNDLRCSVLPDRPAIWRVKKRDVRLSGLVATVLINRGLVDLKDLKLHRAREYQLEDGPWDPVSGVASTLLGTFGSLAMGVADLPTDFYHAVKTRADRHAERRGRPRKFNALAGINKRDLSTASLPITKTETAKYIPSRLSDDTTISLPNIETSSIDAVALATDAPTYLPSLAASNSDLSTTSTFTQYPPSRSTTSFDQTESKMSTKAYPNLKHRSNHSSRSAAHAAEFILKAPLDFASSIAQGFHNAPKLYGDNTVRAPDPITGFQSGLKAAGKEFVLGVYDGISGLVTQPVNDAQKYGAAGVLSGVVKGVGGLVLKPASAVTGVPANLLKGIYKELEKSTDFCLQTHIALSRVAQGLEDAKILDTEFGLEAEIVERWRSVMIEADERAKQIDCVITGRKVHHGLLFQNTRHMTFQEAQLHSAESGLKMTIPASRRTPLDSDTESTTTTESDETIDPKMEVMLPNGKIQKRNCTLQDIFHRLKTGEHKEKKARHHHSMREIFHGKGHMNQVQAVS